MEKFQENLRSECRALEKRYADLLRKNEYKIKEDFHFALAAF